MITHGKGDAKQATKLDRIGERAKADVDTVFNNIGHAVDIELLRECYWQLDRKRAVGIDGVTKEAYGQALERNLENLLRRIRCFAYKPQPSRLVEIPKEDGSTRPLAISCFEDKIVQMAVSNILTRIYEPLFLPCSYGYRPEIGGHEALRALMKSSNESIDGATVEIDVRKYFNSIPHETLMDLMSKKISDKRFLRLIQRLIRAPIMEDGKAVLNTKGCPQGSIISPILANIYLHYAIDTWFNQIKQSYMRGKANLVRFADDMVFVFEDKKDAERFYKVLPKRLEKFGLELHENKSSILETGERAAWRACKQGSRLKTYKFLGFICYWGQSINGSWRLKYRSRSDRITAKLHGLKKYLKQNINQPILQVLLRVKQIVRGWVNYHAISDNHRQVRTFIKRSEEILKGWIN